ncbi:Aste57867_21789 [Aphanomyces stellatus]|uniref:Aste57867_21789 protein n=1 Tax=Aphanomyces stellatus TaxID=120398 RepID=A0A485LJT3_9STRA|nr:hypothetical protein As57867_021720 [Aphanomyces stellatus]VFT98458.1 Aste57867_21789 [Aphanomyces stellatus]
MEHITVVYAGQEHDLEVDVEDTAAVLSFQLFSLLGVDVDSQHLVTCTGRTVLPDETYASFAASSPWLLLSSSSDGSSFNPSIDVDWHESCSRLVAPHVPLVQPAFSANGTPVCQSCAMTCCSQGSLVMPIQNNVETRDRIRGQFICEVDLVVGAADVAVPHGFTKVPVDLNHSVSGPFIFLCYKKGTTPVLCPSYLQNLIVHVSTGGSTRPIAHIKVVHSSDIVPQVKGYTTIPVNCNTGTTSAVGVYLCYRRVPAADFRALQGLALQSVAISPSSSPIEGMVQSPLDLNAGHAGATPLHLYSSTNPLAGFVCGNHGMCLFEPRLRLDKTSETDSWTELSSHQLQAATQLDAALRRQWQASDAKHFEQEEARLKQMLAGQLQNTLKYERRDYQARALATIPMPLLQERARANPTPQPTPEDEVLRQLIRWFKHEFFTWMNSPNCHACGQPNTQSIRQEGPVTPEEVAGEASRVEVYQCGHCRALTRFPRYNDPTKLLETRTGRCGEWANCFTLCCRALGYEARYVHDFTDHVWTEVYSPHHERWLHCDPCEDQLDCPLTYEVGWGKKLSYIFATSCDELVDVVRRYTQDFDSLLDRRTMAREEWLQQTIAELNRTKAHSPGRQEVLRHRALAEAVELSAVKTAKAHETVGRISGSKEWRDSREESGGTAAATAGGSLASATLLATTTSVDANQHLKTLLEGMLKGGCANDTSCVNPFCLYARNSRAGFDVTAYTAESIQAIMVLQPLASPEGLRSLLCPTPGSFRALVLALPLVFYWPLQDHDASAVVDASGHGHHGTATQCALRKPLLVKDDAQATGALLSTMAASLRTTVQVTSESWTLLFLVRWVGTSASTASSSTAPIAFLRLATSDASWTLSYSPSTLQFHWGDHATSLTTLALHSTYLVAVVSTSVGVVGFVNGQESFRAATPIPAASSLDIAFQVDAPDSRHGPVPIVSHVAWVIQPLSAPLLQALVRASIPPPKLSKSGPDGTVDPSLECLETEAVEDSGCRLSSVHLWAGDFFDGLQCEYTTTQEAGPTARVVPGRAWTVANSTKHSLTLMDGEFITHVRGRRGAWMDQLSLTTNFGRTVAGGGNGGGQFDIALPVGHMVRAFHFDLGDHVTSPVVFTCPAPRGLVFAALEKATCEKAVAVQAAQAVTRYLTNLANDPANPKFHKIKCTNAFFEKNVSPLGNAADDIFAACEFSRAVEGSDVFFVFRAGAATHAIHAALFDLAVFVQV